MRYALKKDENEKLIVNFLRQAGASVYIAGLPVDLIVGYRGQTHLVEVKNKLSRYGKQGLNANQKEFASNWLGSPVVILESIEQAQEFVRHINNLYQVQKKP
jgi:hypothetical protein